MSSRRFALLVAIAPPLAAVTAYVLNAALWAWTPGNGALFWVYSACSSLLMLVSILVIFALVAWPFAAGVVLLAWFKDVRDAKRPRTVSS